MKTITCDGVCDVPFQIGLLLLSAVLELIRIPCGLLRDIMTLTTTRILTPLERQCQYLRRRVEGRLDASKIEAEF